MPPAPSPRIPAALQQVFVASNEGKEVHEAPENGIASKVYLRNWVHQSKSESSRSSASCRSLLGSSQEKLRTFRNNIPDITRTPGRKTRRPSFKERSKFAPQTILDEQLKNRNFPTDTYNTLQTAYYSPPNPFQRASYGPTMIRLVRDGDVEGLRDALAAGLSPNPCNQFGESLVHMACRRGKMEVLQVLLDAGASIQVADDYGRTPLHDACWAAEPAFDVVQALLQVDNRLFYMKDCRGALPLSYVHKDHYAEWQAFLEDAALMDPLFPRNAQPSDEAPELCKLWPNARPLSDPKNALPLELVQMVANGKMTAEEARMFSSDASTVAEDDSDDDYYDSDEEDSDEDSDYESDEEEEGEDDSEEGIVQLNQMRFI
eukprot:CAMPEP_0172456780 /NCGR_PEP_ID=MMETSP1065-20121228/17545_1 /TAXON_ID=265537 /ORGANISM="Amphiprora paludosa, Strain CCMP125" /LENGTH=374 /DNA_ID=CAMNT_0013210015 /DNA_START=262 /DNA_END=1386 /DNA_ORIENTATION=-